MSDETSVELPWDDCKVAFSVDDKEAFEEWMEVTDDGRDLHPDNWSLVECDATGARYVVVFRVDGPLRREDGFKVAELIREIEKIYAVEGELETA